MPFKSGKSISDINTKLWNELDEIANEKSRDAARKLVINLKGKADYYVPMDTGDLQQSGEVNQPVGGNGKWTVTLGYYEKYAQYLYYNNFNPRLAGDPSKRGSFINPNAKPFWIDEALKSFDLVREFRINMQ